MAFFTVDFICFSQRWLTPKKRKVAHICSRFIRGDEDHRHAGHLLLVRLLAVMRGKSWRVPIEDRHHLLFGGAVLGGDHSACLAQTMSGGQWGSPARSHCVLNHRPKWSAVYDLPIELTMNVVLPVGVRR